MIPNRDKERKHILKSLSGKAGCLKHKWHFIILIDNPSYHIKKLRNHAKFICEKCGKIHYVKIQE